MVFSGVTVMISLAGLFLVDSTTIRSMAMGAIVVVAVSILAAVTLLPVLMQLLGKRAYTRGRVALVVQLLARSLRTRGRRAGSTHPDNRRGDFWQRWTERVTRRPVVAALASSAVLLVLAIPALSLEFGDGALRQFPKGNETRAGAELAAKELGPGSAGPTQVLASFARGDARTPGNARAVRGYTARLKRDPEVARVAPPRTSRDGRAVMFVATPRHDPESLQARALVERLRAAATAARRFAKRAEIRLAAPPRRSRTSRTSSRARCGRSCCSCWRSATWCCSCCCARCCCRSRPW